MNIFPFLQREWLCFTAPFPPLCFPSSLLVVPSLIPPCERLHKGEQIILKTPHTRTLLVHCFIPANYCKSQALSDCARASTTVQRKLIKAWGTFELIHFARIKRFPFSADVIKSWWLVARVLLTPSVRAPASDSLQNLIPRVSILSGSYHLHTHAPPRFNYSPVFLSATGNCWKKSSPGNGLKAISPLIQKNWKIWAWCNKGYLSEWSKK